MISCRLSFACLSRRERRRRCWDRSRPSKDALCKVRDELHPVPVGDARGEGRGEGQGYRGRCAPRVCGRARVRLPGGDDGGFCCPIRYLSFSWNRRPSIYRMHRPVVHQDLLAYWRTVFAKTIWHMITHRSGTQQAVQQFFTWPYFAKKTKITSDETSVGSRELLIFFVYFFLGGGIIFESIPTTCRAGIN